FVTNGELDSSGTDYVAALAGQDLVLDVWDRSRLAAVATRTQRPELLPDQVTLVANAPPTAVDLDGATKLAIGVIPAEALVRLPGLEDLSLFDPNVRLSLGRTAVNRELAKTAARHDVRPTSRLAALVDRPRRGSGRRSIWRRRRRCSISAPA